MFIYLDSGRYSQVRWCWFKTLRAFWLKSETGLQMRGGQRETEERGRPLQVGGIFNEQGNL